MTHPSRRIKKEIRPWIFERRKNFPERRMHTGKFRILFMSVFAFLTRTHITFP